MFAEIRCSGREFAGRNKLPSPVPICLVSPFVDSFVRSFARSLFSRCVLFERKKGTEGGRKFAKFTRYDRARYRLIPDRCGESARGQAFAARKASFRCRAGCTTTGCGFRGHPLCRISDRLRQWQILYYTNPGISMWKVHGSNT